MLSGFHPAGPSFFKGAGALDFQTEVVPSMVPEKIL
jgi:hypothetical protein